MIDELTKEGLFNNYDVNINQSIKKTTLAFADDVCSLANSIQLAGVLCKEKYQLTLECH